MRDSQRASRLYRAESWIRRAAALRRPDELDSRFISYWIAFNALYGQARDTAEERPREDSSMREFLGKMVRLAGASPGLRRTLQRIEGELLELLKNQFLRREYWEDGFTDGLDDKIHAAEREVQDALRGAGALGRLLIQVFDSLYVLRIQVFHGCAKEGSSANRASLEPAVAIVRRVVPLFWAIVKRAGADEDWGPLSYPAWNRPGHPPEKRTRCFAVGH
ncbi:MAG: hypothetical protein HY725_21705 [Candidatus Rokubacteria bacterium]|nr:hypothetical protein [Candidatus Rokubacteria bacterium]